MCAEAVPWRCHRSLIADAVTVLGIRVEDLRSENRSPVHSMTSFGRVRRSCIRYPFSKGSLYRHTFDRGEVAKERRDHGSESSGSRRGWDSFEDFGQRPADAAENRFGTKDDGPANVQLGEEGRERLAI